MRVFNPEFAARVQARRTIDPSIPVPPAPRKTGKPGPPLNIVLSSDLARRMRQAAKERQASARVLVAALLLRVLERDLVDDLLGDLRPEAIAPGHGRRPVGNGTTLTRVQCAVLYLIGLHADADGHCRLSRARLARILDRGGIALDVKDALVALERRRLIARGEPEGRRIPRRLTKDGMIVCAALGGLGGGA